MKVAPSAGRVAEAAEESWFNFDPFVTSFLRVTGDRKANMSRESSPNPAFFHPFSFIRTLTVGPGITPDLLTFP
jgi:hypothetical protein